MIPNIRVRIAVAIDSGGEWNANGWGGRDGYYDPDAMSIARKHVGAGAAEYWIEADLPIPGPTSSPNARVINGDVKMGEE